MASASANSITAVTVIAIAISVAIYIYTIISVIAFCNKICHGLNLVVPIASYIALAVDTISLGIAISIVSSLLSIMSSEKMSLNISVGCHCHLPQHHQKCW